MTFKQYLKSRNIKSSYISRNSGIPYTTVSEIINGKTEIDRVQIGTGLKIAEVCGISFGNFYNMCKEQSTSFRVRNGIVTVRNKSWYLDYDINGKSGNIRLCKINMTNSRFVREMAEWTIQDIILEEKQKKDIAEVEAWENNIS